jgi:hypothetical protein
VTADQLLVGIARRLQASLRATDAVSEGHALTLARLGGDEFTVLLDEIKDASAAIRVAERLRSALQRPFDVEGHQIFTSATVGIAVSTTGYQRPDDMLRDAATALHRAQSPSALQLFDAGCGRGRCCALWSDLRMLSSAACDPPPSRSFQGDRTDRSLEAPKSGSSSNGGRSLVEFILSRKIPDDHELTRRRTEPCWQMAGGSANSARSRRRSPAITCRPVPCGPDLVTQIEGILRENLLAGSALKPESPSAFNGDLRSAQNTEKLRALGIECSIGDS